MPDSNDPGKFDLAALVIGATLIGLLFVLCLQLLQVREDSVATGSATAVASRSAYRASADMPMPSSGEATAVPEAHLKRDLVALAGTRVGLTMTCVLLAGAVGGYLRYVRERFDDLAVDKPQDIKEQLPPSGGGVEAALAFASRLVIGLSAASVAALFIPLAIADPPGLNIYNPWGLLMLAVVTGYQSSSIFNGLQSKLERLFAEIRRTEAIDEKTVTSAARQGVLDALGAPTPVNFDGKVSLGVVMLRGDGRVLRTDKPPSVELTPKATYAARVLFSPRGVVRPDASSEATAAQWVRIAGGVDAPSIPFDLQVMWTHDLSRDQKVAARTVTIDRASVAHLEDFEFTVPDPGELVAGPPAEITLFVRQHGLVCAVVSLPVRLGQAT